MGVFQNNLMGAAAAAASAGGGDFYTYQIANSCRFDGAASKLVRDPSSDGNLQVLTFSTWVKRSGLGSLQKLYICGEGVSYGYYSDIGFDANDKLFARLVSGSTMFLSTQVFRDTSAFYHIVMSIDTTQSVADNRCKVYVNGERITAWDTDPASTITLNYNTSYTSSLNGSEQVIGNNINVSRYFNGYMGETYLVDGTQLAIGDTGETKNGVWIPKDPSGFTYGTNGFLLNYAASGDIGNDVSGNNNDFTATAIAASDQMLDSPTFGSSNGGNFCTWNPLDRYNYNPPSEGNLRALTAGNNGTQTATFGVSSGKWYFEARNGSAGSGSLGRLIGIAKAATDMSATPYNNADCYLYYSPDGNIYSGGNQGAYGDSWQADGDKVGVAIDLDNGAMWFSKNGTWQNSATQGEIEAGTTTNAAFTGLSGDYKIMVTKTGGTSSNDPHDANFGSDGTFGGAETAGGNADSSGYGNFLYAPPSGFLALNSANLPTAAAVDPAQTDDDYPQELFFMSGYNGNNADRTVTTENQTDLLMIRHWTSGQNWYTLDSTRVITDNKFLDTNSSDAEDTLPQANISSVGATSVGITSSTWLNSAGSSYQMWMWRANGGTTSSNTDGTITSTVQVDPSSGFSIATYTGTGSAATIGHGLGVKPSFILVKNRGAINSWGVYAEGVASDPETDYLVLDTTAAVADDSTYWNDTAPTTDLFSIGTNAAVNTSSGTYVAYCFANIEGYIKSGSYEGNGDADGTFVYTGFRPAFIVTKSVDSTSDWQAFDILRAGYNVDNNAMAMNEALAQTTTDMIDILSNGFKMRIATDPNVAETYVYLAMAHNPFQYATAR